MLFDSHDRDSLNYGGAKTNGKSMVMIVVSVVTSVRWFQ